MTEVSYTLKGFTKESLLPLPSIFFLAKDSTEHYTHADVMDEKEYFKLEDTPEGLKFTYSEDCYPDPQFSMSVRLRVSLLLVIKTILESHSHDYIATKTAFLFESKYVKLDDIRYLARGEDDVAALIVKLGHGLHCDYLIQAGLPAKAALENGDPVIIMHAREPLRHIRFHAYINTLDGYRLFLEHELKETQGKLDIIAKYAS